MQLTKYAHACFTLTKDDKTIVVDPGNLSTDYSPNDNVFAIVITHIHPDHFDRTVIDAIITRNSNAIIIAHQTIIDTLDENYHTQAVAAGDRVAIGTVTLDFYGGQHAVITNTTPVIVNLGVLFDDILYYPGDSFALTDKAVKYLALPVAAPWLKISESIDFLLAIKPQLAFPTHDAILSDGGKTIVDSVVRANIEQSGIEYRRLDGQSINLT